MHSMIDYSLLDYKSQIQTHFCFSHYCLFKNSDLQENRSPGKDNKKEVFFFLISSHCHHKNKRVYLQGFFVVIVRPVCFLFVCLFYVCVYVCVFCLLFFGWLFVFLFFFFYVV